MTCVQYLVYSSWIFLRQVLVVFNFRNIGYWFSNKGTLGGALQIFGNGKCQMHNSYIYVYKMFNVHDVFLIKCVCA